MSFAFNIPFAVERGETMKTVKVTIGNASTTMNLWASEVERLAAEGGVKNGIVWYSGSGTPRNQTPIACALIDGRVAGRSDSNISANPGFNGYAGYRYTNGTVVYIPNAINWTVDSRVGDEYTIAVVDCPWFE